MIRLLRDALFKVRSTWTVHLLMYLVSLLLLTYPLLQFINVLQMESAHKPVLNELVPAFDFLLFGDFMQSSGATLKPLALDSLLFIVLGLLLYTFFSGGVIEELDHHKRSFSIKRFLSTSTRCFPKYLGLLVLLAIMLFSFFLLSGVFYFIFVLFAEGGSERAYFFWLIPPSLLLFILLSFALVLSYYAKIFIYKTPKIPLVDAFWQSFYFVWRYKKTILLFWILIDIGILLLAIYLILESKFGMHSMWGIILTFVFQQLLIFSKFVLKHWNYALALVCAEKYINHSHQK